MMPENEKREVDAICGDSHTNTVASEQCADGNTSNADSCHNSCQFPRCGDTIIDALLNETCDNGTSNSQTANAVCRTNCQLSRCSYGIKDNVLRGEVCDDGNLAFGDGGPLEMCDSCPGDCTTRCPVQQCGDFRCNGTEIRATCPSDCSN